jgi:hypothetical protein
MAQDVSCELVRRDGRWVIVLTVPRWVTDDIERDLDAAKPLVEIWSRGGNRYSEHLMGNAMLEHHQAKPEPPYDPYS